MIPVRTHKIYELTRNLRESWGVRHVTYAQFLLNLSIQRRPTTRSFPPNPQTWQRERAPALWVNYLRSLPVHGDTVVSGLINPDWDGLPANQMSTSLSTDNLICCFWTLDDI
jgi:hypothetical protein